MREAAAGDVLDFWFGQLDDEGLADEEHQKLWWTKSTELDQQIRERFRPLRNAIMAGEREDWLAEPLTRLAYIIVLDQFSRNMHRDEAEMYAADERAAKAALEGIEAGHDVVLGTHERTFLYMPLMHSEDLEDQERCVDLFADMAKESAERAKKICEMHHDYAVQHRDIVKRFGRFPHRNEILDRASTHEELEFLKEPGSSF